MISHIGGDLDIISKKKKQINNVRQLHYEFNTKEIQSIFELVNKGMNNESKLNRFDLDLLKQFGVELTINKKYTENEKQNILLFGKPNPTKKDILKDDILEEINNNNDLDN